jgi:hypothetical protein
MLLSSLLVNWSHFFDKFQSLYEELKLDLFSIYHHYLTPKHKYVPHFISFIKTENNHYKIY